MGWKLPTVKIFFVVANDMEENMWATEYVLRRDLHITSSELESMPLVKVMYFVDKLKKEAEALEAMQKSQSFSM